MAAGKCLTYITAGSMREAAWVCEALNGHTYPGLTVEPMEAVIARPHPDQGGQQYIPQVVHRTTEQEWVPPDRVGTFVRETISRTDTFHEDTSCQLTAQIHVP